jgi:hypothetical protein
VGPVVTSRIGEALAAAEGKWPQTTKDKLISKPAKGQSERAGPAVDARDDEALSAPMVSIQNAACIEASTGMAKGDTDLLVGLAAMDNSEAPAVSRQRIDMELRQRGLGTRHDHGNSQRGGADALRSRLRVGLRVGLLLVTVPPDRAGS